MQGLVIWLGSVAPIAIVGLGWGSAGLALPPPETPLQRSVPVDWVFPDALSQETASSAAELAGGQLIPRDRAIAPPARLEGSADSGGEVSSEVTPDFAPLDDRPDPIADPTPDLEADPLPLPDQPDDPLDDELEALPAGADPELGILELRERRLDRFNRPVPVYGFIQVGYFNSDNIFELASPLDDQLLETTVSLLAYPQLSDRTRAIAQVEAGLVSYVEFPVVDYTKLELQAGVRHQLSPRSYGELTWSNRQLVSRSSGDRFLNEHALEATLFRRDPLTPDLSLSSYYQLSWRLADPEQRSRVINTAGATLTYGLTDRLDVSLNSQVSWSDFTRRDRVDTSVQVLAQLSYQLSQLSRISLYSGFAAGDSTSDFLNPDRFMFGANLSLGVRLF